jgi:hypothetical protein
MGLCLIFGCSFSILQALHRAYTKAIFCDFENEKIIEQKLQ